MIRILIIALFVLAHAPQPAAREAATPRLKELVTVTADVVRIGDLVEHAGPAANVAVFRAPDLGETGSVDVGRVAEALKPHQIANLDTAGISQVVVTRLSRAIPAAEIEERLADAFAGQFGLGEARNLSITTDRPLRALHVEASATGELAIARLNVDQRSGRFDVQFELPGAVAVRRAPLRITGTVIETVETVIVARALSRGDTVKASDLVVARRRKSDFLNGAIAAGEAVGLAVKRPLRTGEVLRATDLMKAEVVRRNETVTILYRVPGITLTVRGKALEAGAIGETISVTNVQSNRTVQATVEAPGLVVIAAPIPVVTAMTPVVPIAPAAIPEAPVERPAPVELPSLPLAPRANLIAPAPAAVPQMTLAPPMPPSQVPSLGPLALAEALALSPTPLIEMPAASKTPSTQ